MRRAIGSAIIALSAYQVNAVVSNCTLSSWSIGGNIPLGTTDCNLATVTAALGSSCLSTLYGTNTTAVAVAVQSLCASMEDPFGSISNVPVLYQNDKNYMDGGTLLNYGDQSKADEKVATIGGQIGRYITNKAAKARIAWPKYAAVSDSGFDASGYMVNFHLDKSCALRAAMCCFVGTLLPTQTMTKNADVCVHDLANSKNASHVRRGWARYDIVGKDAYCVGFSWDANVTSVSNKYKGNALFAASLKQTYQNGYSKNVPGAPMCGCVEQMPIVSDAACVSVDSATETAVTLIYRGTNATTNMGYPLVAQLSTAVTYGNCGGKSLKQQYATTSTASEQTALAARIVDSCNITTTKFLNERFYVPGFKKSDVDLTKWTPIVGEGSLYYPMIGEDEFRKLMVLRPDGRYPIVYRYCTSCWSADHRNIYYRRNATKPYPTSLDYLDLFMNSWTSLNNTLGVDFMLYSTYTDALYQTNPWLQCNYDYSGIGFPRDCGKTALTTDNWNSYDPRVTYGAANHHAFYVEK